MIYKIAVCDDSLATRIQICDLLKRIEVQDGLQFDIHSFSSAEDLLARMPEDTQLLLLDIVMDGETGIKAAQRLRKNNRSLCIIFITSMVQYALECYSVHPLGFLKKPLEYNLFRREILDAIYNIDARKGRKIILNRGTLIEVLDTNEIIYAEILGRDLKIVLKNDSRQYTTPLKDLEQKLVDCHFFRCHKSYIVNFQYVLNITANDILLANGQRIPMSKYRRKEFLETFTAYVGNHGNTPL